MPLNTWSKKWRELIQILDHSKSIEVRIACEREQTLKGNGSFWKDKVINWSNWIRHQRIIHQSQQSCHRIFPKTHSIHERVLQGNQTSERKSGCMFGALGKFGNIVKEIRTDWGAIPSIVQQKRFLRGLIKREELYRDHVCVGGKIQVIFC